MAQRQRRKILLGVFIPFIAGIIAVSVLTGISLALSEEYMPDNTGPGWLNPSLNAAYDINITEIDRINITGSVECYSGNCMDVVLHIMSSDTKDYVGETFGNPKICGNMTQGSSCNNTWSLNGMGPGTYYLYTYYESSSVTGGIQHSNQMQKIYVESPQISVIVQEPATLFMDNGSTVSYSGIIRCVSGYCGDITAYLKDANGITIVDGLLSTVRNPMSPYECRKMNSGDYCSIEWEITGNTESDYKGIGILAVSDRIGLYNMSSGKEIRVVPMSPGNLSVDMISVIPNQSHVGMTCIASSTIRCKDGICGEVSATIRTGSEPISGSPDGIYSEQNTAKRKMSRGESWNVSWEIHPKAAGNYSINAYVSSLQEGVDPVISGSALLHIENDENYGNNITEDFITEVPTSSVNLTVDVIEPEITGDGIFIDEAGFIDIMINASYGNSDPYYGGIFGVLMNETENYTIVFEPGANPGEYVTTFKPPESEIEMTYTMEILQSDGNEIAGKIDITVGGKKPKGSWLPWLIVVGALLLGFSVWHEFTRKKLHRNNSSGSVRNIPSSSENLHGTFGKRIETLNIKRNAILRAKKITEDNKSKMNEETFRNIVTDYEKKIAEIDSEIGELESVIAKKRNI